MFKSIFGFIHEKQRESDERFTQKKLDAWFKADHIFIEEVTPETERIFAALSIDEPIKLVCDYYMPPFNSSKYNLDPAPLKKLQEYFSQDFGIAIYTEKTNQKLGYLPLLTNVESELYREGSYMQAVHDLLRKNVKVYTKLVRIERNDNPLKPIVRSTNPNYRPPEKIYIIELHINTDLDKLNKSVKERRQYLEEQRIEREIETARIKSALKNSYVYDEDDFLDSRSVWDEYDEDGVPYEDYDMDESFHDDLDGLDEGLKDSQPENRNEESDSESVWDEYDEDGVPYEDYKK